MMDASDLTTDVSAWASNLSDDAQKVEQRFILTRVEQLTIVFPSDVVADISIIERSQILILPFYDPRICGILHRSGQIMPLVSLRHLLGIPELMTERLTVLRLNPVMGDLAGVGLIVDTTLGTSSTSELPSDLFSSEMFTGSSKFDSKMRLFQAGMLGDLLWQPLRWQTLTA
jgi:hypothetical protein